MGELPISYLHFNAFSCILGVWERTQKDVLIEKKELFPEPEIKKFNTDRRLSEC